MYFHVIRKYKIEYRPVFPILHCIFFMLAGLSHLAVMPDQSPEYEIEGEVSTTRDPLEEKTANLIHVLNTSTSN